MLSNKLDVPLSIDKLHIKKNTLIVDDLVDSGKTMFKVLYIIKRLNVWKGKTITLYRKDCTKFNPDFYCNKCKEDEWISYPWEYKNSKMKRDGTVE